MNKKAQIGTDIEGVDEKNNTILFKKYGPGKFDNNVDEYIYTLIAEGNGKYTGDEIFGEYAVIFFMPPMIVKDDGGEWPLGGATMHEDSQGFVYTDLFGTEAEADNAFDKIVDEYDHYTDEHEEE